MSKNREEFLKISSLSQFSPPKIRPFPVVVMKFSLSWSTSPTVATYQTWSKLAKQF